MPGYGDLGPPPALEKGKSILDGSLTLQPVIQPTAEATAETPAEHEGIQW